jgi:L-arabinokinase
MVLMTAAWGRRAHLLALLCQPAEIVDHLPLPPGLEVYGIDSGIRHAVTGADYGSVRAAAFMGYRIVAAAAGLAVRPAGAGRVAIDDQIYDGYLANVPPAVWRRRFRDTVPERMDGAAFLARYQGSTDAVTAVDPARSYPVRAATEHPIYEHARVSRFRDILAGGAASAEARGELGELMFASHASYSACGLGAGGTDRLVELARAAGPVAGVYGAKITGGGSGGTVAVLAAAGRRAVIDAIANRYQGETGRKATVFSNSSNGARATGLARITP